MDVSAFTVEDTADWNIFVAESRNGTFLLDRGYMEYHRDRFMDASLVVREKGRPIALFPASRNGTVVTSHGGLTYGGLILRSAGVDAVARVLDAVVAHYARIGVSDLIYKTIPTIYHRAPAEDDRHALFLRDAQLIRRDVLSVIDYNFRLPKQERRARSLRKGFARGLRVEESFDFAAFWGVLAGNLMERYGVAPVHSLSEIESLAGRFPDNIRLYVSRSEGHLTGGAVVFLSPNVCHVQYNAASPAGRETGGLDVVLETLVDEFSAKVRFFDFGISTEHGGRVLNHGLVEYKESFGARSVAHDFYRIAVGDRDGVS